MRIKQSASIVGFGLSFLFAGLSSVGAAGFQAYPGRSLPRSQVAVIYFDRTQRFRMTFATLMDVDNRHLHRASPNTPMLFRGKDDIPPYIDSFEVLPGHHVIQLEVIIQLVFGSPNQGVHPVYITRPATKSIDVEAGKAYSLTPGYSGGREISHIDTRTSYNTTQRKTTYEEVNVWIDFWESNPARSSGPVTWAHAPSSSSERKQ